MKTRVENYTFPMKTRAENHTFPKKAVFYPYKTWILTGHLQKRVDSIAQ